MRVLLDTNILIHREAAVVVRQDIGPLFNWLDRLRYDKCVHPVSVKEIEQHRDERVRRSFAAKIASYRVLRAPAPMTAAVASLSAEVDSTPNDRNDSQVLNELYAQRVDLIITEDRGIARKAERLGIGDRVFTIDSFLEKVAAENPDLVDYKVLSVRKALFGEMNLSDPFFDSFREDYPEFDRWFNRKSDESAYVCVQDDRLVAFLYLKPEDEREPYPDVFPPFSPKRRLKIGTYKVELNGQKLGERFLKIVFDNAVRMRADEVYVTIFPRSAERERLIKLLEDFGFCLHGEKRNAYGSEEVYVRDMTPRFNRAQPRLTFPYISRSARAFLVPIYPEYHTDLFPDSILKTESPGDFVEQEPHRNSIRKVYVSRSICRELASGDIIVFYRTGGKYRSVVTTLGIIEGVHLDLKSEEEFIRRCRKRSVFTDEELRQQWRHSTAPPFVVDFLYAYSFPKRPNMAALIEHRVIRDENSAPRGFERITDAQFGTVLELAQADSRIVVD
jgi:predicted nucleic acid-binding protein